MFCKASSKIRQKESQFPTLQPNTFLAGMRPAFEVAEDTLVTDSNTYSPRPLIYLMRTNGGSSDPWEEARLAQWRSFQRSTSDKSEQM
jgi:hypothetical protein